MVGLSSSEKKRAPAEKLVKYALVGIMSNASGYAAFLLLTALGAPPKSAMTAVYSVGALIGFLGNRSLTFCYQGHLLGAGLRYILAQVVGYVINLCMLAVFVDQLGYAHQMVQAAAILIVAIYLFFALKFYVFKVGP